MFTLRLISPLQCGSFSEEGEGKKIKTASSLALLRLQNPTPSHLQTRQQTGPLCQSLANGPLPVSRGRYLEARSPPGLWRRRRLAFPGATAVVCEGKRVEKVPGKPPTRVPVPAPAPHTRGPWPLSPGSPPKVVNAVIRGRWVSCAGSDSDQGAKRAQQLGGARREERGARRRCARQLRPGGGGPHALLSHLSVLQRWNLR